MSDIASIAFPSISTGVYRCPIDQAARIALTTTVESLRNALSIQRVIFCCFSDKDLGVYQEARKPLLK